MNQGFTEFAEESSEEPYSRGFNGTSNISRGTSSTNTNTSTSLVRALHISEPKCHTKLVELPFDSYKIDHNHTQVVVNEEDEDEEKKKQKNSNNNLAATVCDQCNRRLEKETRTVSRHLEPTHRELPFNVETIARRQQTVTETCDGIVTSESVQQQGGLRRRKTTTTTTSAQQCCGGGPCRMHRRPLVGLKQLKKKKQQQQQQQQHQQLVVVV